MPVFSLEIPKPRDELAAREQPTAIFWEAFQRTVELPAIETWRMDDLIDNRHQLALVGRRIELPPTPADGTVQHVATSTTGAG
jgi:hypothetical protein